MEYEPVIGLEVHAELRTRSKMFCGCAVVDSASAPPNSAVCPICTGMPGSLPVANRMAVEYGIRVALALDCTVNPVSIFARKNYFYPDLPKGYQISQYEEPLAVNGKLMIETSEGERTIRVRRVHLEEDTGKLTHVNSGSLVDLNRAGVPLLEIVSEPDMRSVEEARAYAESLREILRYLEVNSGDMEKGVIRFEANISVRPVGTDVLNTRVEIKNLNSFRALERATAFEIARQSHILAQGGTVEQETLGWNEASETTYSQRSKEDAHDYRYFPEPDLPPLVVDGSWLERVREDLPELPRARYRRFIDQYGLTEYDARVLTSDKAIAEYFEAAVDRKSEVGNRKSPIVNPKSLANWMTGDLFGLMNQADIMVADLKVRPEALAELVGLVSAGEINQSTGKAVLSEMVQSGKSAQEIVEARGLQQISDESLLAGLVRQVLDENPGEVTSFKAGKETVANWLFGQVMRKAAGKANPQVVRAELERQLRE